MTVEELINELSRVPQEATVKIYDPLEGEGRWVEVDYVVVHNECEVHLLS